MSASIAERIAQEHAAASSALPSSVVSLERRQRAAELLASKGLPTGRDENWKYANLRPVEKVRFAPASAAARATLSEADLPPAIAGYSRYVFVDGVFAPDLSASGAPNGVSVTAAAGHAVGHTEQPSIAGRLGETGPARTRTAEPPSRPAIEGSSSPDDRFALLNDAFAVDVARVHAPREANCAACVEVLFVATAAGAEAASYPRLEVEVDANARVGLIERHVSAGKDTSFVNGVVHVSVSEGGKVDHYRLQQTGTQVTWVNTLNATVARNASYSLYCVQIGALSARSTNRVQLHGEGAETSIYVVSVADGQQVHDGFALVEHIAPNTKSEQSVRGIAGGRSRVAFNSKVVVREHARGTDSKQSLRGLLAGAQAEIDVRPQLEIYTDDVRCNHGATAGKLDDNMLFYLLSRGIERDVAQQLLKWAFLEDGVSRIAVPELRRQIELSLAGQMKETAALKELL
jgi:Fe-S cluster assembly protein SufD